MVDVRPTAPRYAFAVTDRLVSGTRVACVDVNMTQTENKTDKRKSKARPTEAVLLRLLGAGAFDTRGAITSYAGQWGISKQALSARLARLRKRINKQTSTPSVEASTEGV